MDRRGAAQEHLHAQQLERHAHKYIYVGAGAATRGRMTKGTAFRREAGVDNRDNDVHNPISPMHCVYMSSFCRLGPKL